MKSEYMTIEQTAKYLNIKVSAVRYAIKMRYLRFFKLSHRLIRIKILDADDFKANFYHYDGKRCDIRVIKKNLSLIGR